VEVRDNGAATLDWVRGNVERKIHHLTHDHPQYTGEVVKFARGLRSRGVTPEQTYLFMHGHTLLDNVVMPMLNAVCDKLKWMGGERIITSAQRGVAFSNEISNYRNAQASVRDTLVHNEGYKGCPLYRRLRTDIADLLRREGLA
jgi:hypothetical protein